MSTGPLHACGYLSLAEWMRGRLTQAEQLLSSTIAQWRAAGEHALAAWGCHHLCPIQRAQGCLDAARGAYQQAVHLTAVPGRPHLPAAGTGCHHPSRAMRRYEPNDGTPETSTGDRPVDSPMR